MALPEIGPLIATGKQAEVFEAGPLVLKLARAAGDKRETFREAAILTLVETLDLPAPAVHGVLAHEERWGLLIDRVEGPPFAERMLAAPETIGAHFEAMARLHRLVHERPGAGLPDLVMALDAAIARAPVLGDALRRRLREGLKARPGGDRLCHGDFHPYNVMGALDAPMLIDWLDARCGAPEADVCRSYVLMAGFDEALARAYVAAYLGRSGGPQEAVFAWLPYIAAARIAEDVPEETAALVAMAERV